MSLPAHPACRRRFPAFFLPALALALGLAGQAALAADLNLEAQLIWGANDSPATVKHVLADPELAAPIGGECDVWGVQGEWGGRGGEG